MTVTEFCKDRFLYLDGGMGTLLFARGLRPGEAPETWNLSNPDVIREIHAAYFAAGANVVNTNTFGANLLRYSEEELCAVVTAAVTLAKEARDASPAPGEKFVALDIGPTGKMLAPFGDLDPEDAVRAFAATVKIGAEAGADLVMIETMGDVGELRAALLAAKENCDLPVFVSCAYGKDGKLMTGGDVRAVLAMAEGMGAAAVGANCSEGPAKLQNVAAELLRHASVPVLFKPNAGLPRDEGGRTVYDVSPEEFAAEMRKAATAGVTILGGCCGTTPEHIRALVAATKDLSPLPVTEKNETVVSSYTHAVTFGGAPVVIGERINPTGKKKIKEALKAGDHATLLAEALNEEEHGADLLDVNAGLPEIDERAVLAQLTEELQGVTALPLALDSADPAALEAALRRYRGRALINSVSGKEASMRAVFPLMKKYGAAAIALTLDEDGIPATAEGRVRIAEKILARGAEYGIGKKDLIFDPLTMTVSTDGNAALVTLEAVRRLHDAGCHTSLGVSNVSFGLPARDGLNSYFLTAALENGLSAAILNPVSDRMKEALRAYRVLHGLDAGCAGYIAAAETATAEKTAENRAVDLRTAVLRGLRDAAAELAREKVKTCPPLLVVEEDVIPALDEVGRGYEEGRLYLPQLLMSAEAASSAFEEVKRAMPKEQDGDGKIPVVLATVEGDIHDIGKNIVKLLLENYGFPVYDLGRDVPPDEVLRAVLTHHAPLCGLSALMTTTVPAMEKTVALIHREAPFCRVVVGGAVLNAEYARKIGADFYAADAMETVRTAERVAAKKV